MKGEKEILKVVNQLKSDAQSMELDVEDLKKGNFNNNCLETQVLICRGQISILEWVLDNGC